MLRVLLLMSSSEQRTQRRPRAWAGLRPATPDGRPHLGPLPPLRNLWVSAGHFRKGILLAPLCARLLAGSILADHLDERLEPFKPTRRM